jgi:hypothetical protein
MGRMTAWKSGLTVLVGERLNVKVFDRGRDGS